MIEVVDVQAVHDMVPLGVQHDEDASIRLCGNACPDRREVRQELRHRDLAIKQMGCLGLCNTYPEVTDGAFAVVKADEASVDVLILPERKRDLIAKISSVVESD